MQNRQNALSKWLEHVLAPAQFSVKPLAGDASFRRYFRLHSNGQSQVIMDAPPDKEALEPFLTVANLLAANGVRTPKVHHLDKAQGFAILDDFGDNLLLNSLDSDSADKLYKLAMDTLIRIQTCPAPAAQQLPRFDSAFILSELKIFREWFLDAYLKLDLSLQEEALLSDSFAYLCEEISQQPLVVIHRDYHSRNLMLLNNNEDLGVIDFQDAMYGPFTYDLVSLLKDCYVQWPRDQIMNWLMDFHKQAPAAKQYNLDAFIRAFDLCGLQRHLKVLGVFSRLHLRDNKPNYLQDLPLTLHYVLACLENYKELRSLYDFMQIRIRLP